MRDQTRRGFLQNSFRFVGLAVVVLTAIHAFGPSAVEDARALGILPVQMSQEGACNVNAVLLIHSDSTDGSTVFQDSGGTANCPHTITANGHVHHEVDQKKFGATSIYFDGTGDNLQISDTDADWTFGTGNFTIDFWVRVQTGTAYMLMANGYFLDNLWGIRVTALGKILVTYGSASSCTSTGSVTTNTWTHVAVERHGDNLNIYFDGVKDATAGNSMAGINLSGLADLYIGDYAAETDFLGYLDEIRISNVARHGGVNFTPESGPYCQ